MALVDAGFVTAVVMLKLKWRRAGNGTVISVDQIESDCWGRKCRILYFKLDDLTGRTRHWKKSYD